MVHGARELIAKRDLLFAWTVRTIRGRYQQSILGWLWAIVQPAASVTIFTIIFTRIVPVNTGDIPYPVFSFVAVVIWTFFSASLTDMTASLIQNMTLVTKIYFPREAIPIAAMLARLMDFGVALALLVVLLLMFRIPIFLTGWLYLPGVLAVQLMLTIGLGLICAALNIFYRDVQSLLSLVIQLWFYASPIIYPVSEVPSSLQPFYYFNPMTGLLESYRDILIRGHLPGSYLVPATIISCAIFLTGYWFFKRVEFKFADIV
jgi:lipopolysaccharide transport system permease protein